MYSRQIYTPKTACLTFAPCHEPAGCCSSWGGSVSRGSFEGVFNSQLFSPEHIITHRLSPHSAKNYSSGMFSAPAPPSLGSPFYFFITSSFGGFMWLLFFPPFPDRHTLLMQVPAKFSCPQIFAISWFSYRTALQ